MELAPSIRTTLSAVRRRIRSYVWLEGISLAVIWLGVTFWLALALDYFPVLVWASEMPRPARAIVLMVVTGVLGYILFRYLLSRAFVPIHDRSLAVLLERQFDGFQDSLVTAVELSDQRDHADPYSHEMLVHTHENAVSRVSELKLANAFNYRPLVAKLLIALLLVASITTFSVAYAPAFEIAGQRLYLLNDIPWPRNTEIEVVGLEVQRGTATETTAASTQPVNFIEQRAKIARGASCLLRVRASADKRVPETCSIVYRTGDGDRGTVLMKKVGRPKDGYQHYVFDGKPFKGILSTLTFDVIGYDHRVRGFEIDVVESPALIETTLACEFPAYMVDEANSQWLPREESLTPATQLPQGTKLWIKCRANKPLMAVEVRNIDTNVTTQVTVAGEESFSLPATLLTNNLTLELTLQDTDGVPSDRPQRLFIPAVKDEAPRVSVRLAGISSLVTPDVAIPIVGTIEDDYAIGKAWFDVTINDTPPQSLAFLLTAGQKVDKTIDFRELRSSQSEFAIKPDDKLTLAVIGQDKHNLEGGPQSGFGDRWELKVVTPDELLSSLESRELGLRRRYEQIITEVTEMRDELLRAAIEAKLPTPSSDDSDDEKTDEEGVSLSLRLLIAQRAVQQSQKSTQELLGVAVSFADIRSELINNRVDTEERKTRLKEHIAEPLELLATTMFPILEQRLEKMQATASDPVASPMDSQAAADQASAILVSLEEILQRMLDLETYNELVELVRSLIEEQEQLMSETKKQQAADLLK